MSDEREVYEKLTRLSPLMLGEVIIRAAVPKKWIPPDSEAPAKRALALVDWASETPENLSALCSALDQLHLTSGPVSIRTGHPPPTHFSLLFNRDDHEEEIELALKNTFRSQQRIMAILLPGPTDEAHGDFIARYIHFNFRKFCRDNELAYSIDREPKTLDWPSPKRKPKQRLKLLFEELSNLMDADSKKWVSGQPDQAFTEKSPESVEFTKEMGEKIRKWLAQDKKHRVIDYQLSGKAVGAADSDLLRQWLNFWSHLNLGEQTYFITLFFSVRTSRRWQTGIFSACGRCVERIRKYFESKPQILILKPLAPPSRDDIDRWVDHKCGEAWLLEGRLEKHDASQEHAPLHYGTLWLHAEAAFMRQVGFLKWRISHSPFRAVKGQLETAIEKAHEMYLARGTGR